jgi:hypothetical protein
MTAPDSLELKNDRKPRNPQRSRVNYAPESNMKPTLDLLE